MSRARRFVVAAALSGALIAAGAPIASAHGRGSEPPRVVASGLDNPRGLAFGPGGDLYVAESGRGGTDCGLTSPEGDAACFGETGAVTRVDPRGGRQERIATGLPSIAVEGGGEASGPSDVSFGWGWQGFLTVGLGADPAAREEFPQTAGMATLYALWPNGRVRPVADLGAFEAAENPDADQPESSVDTNPNSVDATSHHVVVADAGGNDVLEVKGHKRISVLGVIPFSTAPAPDIPDFPVPPGTPIPTQSVPTSVVRGPDGAYYVGQLTGFPFPVGGANVWRIAPGSAPEVYASGFTQITDLGFGPDGNLYVLEIATGSLLGPPTPGALIRVERDGSRTELAAGTLQGPTGLALGHDAAYVSNHGAEAGTGEVVRIPLAHHRRHH